MTDRYKGAGATAMQQVHEMEGCNIWIARRHQDSKRVHVGTAAAMTGVSRFLEIQRKWVYHKVCRACCYSRLLNRE